MRLFRLQSWKNLFDVVTARIGSIATTALFFLSFGVTLGKSDIKVSHFKQDLTVQEKSMLDSVLRDLRNANEALLWPARFSIRFTPGMSGQGFRAFLNDLMKSRSNYLEIGTWKGSTAVSAISGNCVNAILIDNWAEFGGPSGSAFKNIGRRVGQGSAITILSADFRNAPLEAIMDGSDLSSPTDETDVKSPFVSVYLFDGPHEYQDHYDGAHIVSRLRPDPRNGLIFIVDDYSWEKVRRGTEDGVHSLPIRPFASIEVSASMRGKWRSSRFHNGYGIFLFSASP